MANFLLNSAWTVLKPAVRDWLTTRALVLPAAKKAELAKRFNVPVSVVQAVSDELAAQAVASLESFKP